MQVERQFVSVCEAAALTGLSAATIRRRVTDGTFSSIKVGRRRLVRASELERLGTTAATADQLVRNSAPGDSTTD